MIFQRNKLDKTYSENEKKAIAELNQVWKKTKQIKKIKIKKKKRKKPKTEKFDKVFQKEKLYFQRKFDYWNSFSCDFFTYKYNSKKSKSVNLVNNQIEQEERHFEIEKDFDSKKKEIWNDDNDPNWNCVSKDIKKFNIETIENTINKYILSNENFVKLKYYLGKEVLNKSCFYFLYNLKKYSNFFNMSSRFFNQTAFATKRIHFNKKKFKSNKKFSLLDKKIKKSFNTFPNDSRKNKNNVFLNTGIIKKQRYFEETAYCNYCEKIGNYFKFLN